MANNTKDNTSADELEQKFAATMSDLVDNCIEFGQRDYHGTVRSEKERNEAYFDLVQLQDELIDCHKAAVKQRELALLERVEKQAVNCNTYSQPDGSQYGSSHEFLAVPLSVIQKEKEAL